MSDASTARQSPSHIEDPHAEGSLRRGGPHAVHASPSRPRPSPRGAPFPRGAALSLIDFEGAEGRAPAKAGGDGSGTTT